MCRRVGNHDRCELTFVISDFFSKVLQRYITIFSAIHDDHSQASHDGRSSIGPMCGGRNQAYISTLITLRLVVALDCSRPANSPCEPRGLERYRRSQCTQAAILLNLRSIPYSPELDQVEQRGEYRRSRPSDRFHFSCCVQLHGSRFRGIMPRSRAMSLSDKRRIYLSISVSDLWVLKTA